MRGFLEQGSALKHRPIRTWIEIEGFDGDMTEVREEHQFENARGLLDYLTERLRLIHGVPLPSFRDEQ